MTDSLTTSHVLRCSDARTLDGIAAASIDLVVTSPPYPMVAMWDDGFTQLDPAVGEALARDDGEAAFDLMHAQLDRVWSSVVQALKPGGFLCVNVGDAARTCADTFRLFPNHARILQKLIDLGMTPLPDILWRKPTNGPTKFMGSGMLPAGAYVTYEHEYVLILRRGDKREFRTAEDKLRRRQSAFFWEERNVWFSDVWTDLRGTRQKLGPRDLRSRSGAFPFELPWRLIQMYSLAGDTVLDPFAGTGTTLAAAAASGRSSIGYEVDAGLEPTVAETLAHAVDLGNDRIDERLARHRDFVEDRVARERPLRHENAFYGVPVMTSQEREAAFWRPVSVTRDCDGWQADLVLSAERPAPDEPTEVWSQAALFEEL